MATKSTRFNLPRFLLTILVTGFGCGIFFMMMSRVFHSYSYNYSYSSLWGLVLIYYGFLMIFSFALGLLLALIRRTGLGRGFFGKFPIEFYVLGVLFLTAIFEIAFELLNAYMTSELVLPIAEFLVLPIDLATGLCNFMVVGYFAFLSFFSFEAGASLGMGIRDGFISYLKCRCWTIRTGLIIFTNIAKAFRFVVRKIQSFFYKLHNISAADPIELFLFKVVALQLIVLIACCCLWFIGIVGAVIYSIVLFFLLRRWGKKLQQQYHAMLEATRHMAAGNLHAPVPTCEHKLLQPLQENLCQIRNGFSHAVSDEVRSQNMKTELITNVSHDLKTPLTAIITYVDLLKDPTLDNTVRAQYVATLDKKSQRLKQLIEDLFEISKASSGNVSLLLQEVDLTALLKQVQFEMEEQMNDCDIDFRWGLPDKKINLTLDGQRTCRIFENLIGNILKYSLPGTRAYIDIEEQETTVRVVFKNISAQELLFDPAHITDRFVRGDAARNTEGSGLGLAIAQSFTDLQGGAFWIETDGDLFKATVQFPLISVRSNPISLPII